MPGLFIKSGKMYQLYTSYLSINFWWNCFEFIDKIDLNIQMRIFNNIKYRHAICLKLGNRLFTSLTMSGHEEKAINCSEIKENLILYCRKFMVCWRCHKLTYFNNKVCLTKKDR